MRKWWLVLAIFIPLCAYSQSSYLCIADATTGFRYDNNSKEWVKTSFKTADEKYILKKNQEGWEWLEFGSKTGMQCGEINEYGWLHCTLWVGSLKFNKNNLRYLRTYDAGYVDGKNNNDNTPVISIGKCSPL
jgi:hypothetical protein